LDRGIEPFGHGIARYSIKAAPNNGLTEAALAERAFHALILKSANNARPCRDQAALLTGILQQELPRADRCWSATGAMRA